MFGSALKVRHFSRYLDIAWLLRKYARGGLEIDEDPHGHERDPEELARDLEKRGPTFVKLGQLPRPRPDLLPQPYVDALARLQDNVGPFPNDVAFRIIEEELDVKLNKIFKWIGPEPLAAASLAQIYKAELRDGRLVAVKVQRPNIREQIVEDMAAIGEAAAFLDKHSKFGRRYELARLLEEFRTTMLSELDYMQEAANLRALADNLESFDRLVIPQPYEDFTTWRVLTMDFLPGKKVTALTPLILNEIEGAPMADQLFRAYLKQILVDGFFHADPHPGNIILTDDKRIGILDLGMVGRIGPMFQKDLLSLLLALSEGRSEDAATQAIKMGTKRQDFNEETFRRKVSHLVLSNKDSALGELDVGGIMMALTHVAGACGLRPPLEVAMIGKTLLNLDQVVTTLDPGFEPAEVVREESAALLRSNIGKGMSQGNVSASILELLKFGELLPERLGKVLDVVGGNEFRMKVDTVDEKLLIQGMQKIANRIAMGVILASLVIGAAQMMRVETTFRIMEYPGLAIILFAIALIGCFGMILTILRSDDHSDPSPR